VDIPLFHFPFENFSLLIQCSLNAGAIKKTLHYVLPKQSVDMVEVKIDSSPTGKQVPVVSFFSFLFVLPIEELNTLAGSGQGQGSIGE